MYVTEVGNSEQVSDDSTSIIVLNLFSNFVNHLIVYIYI
jgi:hypothetical protein